MYEKCEEPPVSEKWNRFPDETPIPGTIVRVQTWNSIGAHGRTE